MLVMRLLVLVCIFSLSYENGWAVNVASSDWPQWGGASRDFKTNSNNLADRWPDGGPRRIWVRPLGAGHSSIVSDNGRLYTMYRKNGSEFVVCLDAANGKTLWEHSYPAPYILEWICLTVRDPTPLPLSPALLLSLWGRPGG